MDRARRPGSPPGTPRVAVPATDAVQLGDVRPGSPEPSRADLLARVAFLEGKLISLPAIEQAKGALMVTYGISADAAFSMLRFHSQNRNVKVRTIAAQLTTLMCHSTTSAEAITQFDRLLDDVAHSLEPAATAPAAPEQTVAQPVAGIAPGELSEVMLRAVATAPPGITIAGYTAGLPLVYVNDAFTAMTGYPMLDVLGRNCRFLQGSDTKAEDIATLSRAIKEGRDASVRMRNYRRTGEPFWNEVSISPIRNRTNQITHFIGTQIDITDRVGEEALV